MTFLIALAALLPAAGCPSPADGAPDDGYVALGPDRVYYEARGQGYPVVLVGGGSGMDLRQWDPVFERMAEQFRVIRYDPRGVGRSDNPTVDYSDADDLEALVEDLGYKRVVAIGVSSAGGLALQFAAAHPGRVTAVVAVAPFVPGFDFDDAMQQRLQEFSSAADSGREPFLDAMFGDPHFIPAPLAGEVRAVARENMAENFDKAATADSGRLRPFFPPLIRRLGELQVPVLLLGGELDHPEILRRNDFLASQIAGSRRRRIPQAGHNAPLENPEGFLAEVVPFLKATLPIGR